MIRTRVGYAGGLTPNPTYREMGDHSETIQFDYDPNQVTFEALLDMFWKNHNVLRKDRSTQYRSILFLHNNEQKDRALKKKREWEQVLNGEIQTAMVPYSDFFPAEDYHQKYYLKRFKKAAETLISLYPNHEEFVHSTLTARLNGFVKGYGTWEGLKKETEHWGLKPADHAELIEVLNSLRW